MHHPAIGVRAPSCRSASECSIGSFCQKQTFTGARLNDRLWSEADAPLLARDGSFHASIPWKPPVGNRPTFGHRLPPEWTTAFGKRAGAPQWPLVGPFCRAVPLQGLIDLNQL